MKIELLCPKCHSVLLDKFSAGNCNLITGSSHWLDMECLKCGKLHRVLIETSRYPSESSEPDVILELPSYIVIVP